MTLGIENPDDVPSKAVTEWNGRRLTFVAIFCFSVVIMITCAVIGKTLSSILAFALMVISFLEFQGKNDGERHKEDLDLTQIARREGLELDKFLSNPQSHTASKVLMKCMIKEYLVVLARLQKYENYSMGQSSDDLQHDEAKSKDGSEDANVDQVVLDLEAGGDDADGGNKDEESGEEKKKKKKKDLKSGEKKDKKKKKKLDEEDAE